MFLCCHKHQLHPQRHAASHPLFLPPILPRCWPSRACPTRLVAQSCLKHVDATSAPPAVHPLRPRRPPSTSWQSSALVRWYARYLFILLSSTYSLSNGSLCNLADILIQGLGIALVAARAAQVPVTLLDTSQASIDKGLAFADKLLAKDVSKDRISQSDADAVRARLTPTTNMDDLHDVDMVIEAVPEILSLKTSIFAQLAQTCPSHAILATNTSSISITRIAAATTKVSNHPHPHHPYMHSSYMHMSSHVKHSNCMHGQEHEAHARSY